MYRFLAWGERLIERGAWFLAPFSFLYAFGVWVRNLCYDKKWIRTIKVKPVVVSIGNIVAGGTGKTPFVHLLASAFSHKKVAILSRGYGEIPDEAIWLARKLPKARVYIGKNRAEMAQDIDADLIILDDGFQHRKLARDVEIVLEGRKAVRYLPWGFLRDSPARLCKADEVFQSGIDYELKVEKIVSREGKEIDSIAGWKVAIFCGIANPDRFKKTVESLGAIVVEQVYFGDHEKADLNRLPRTLPLICTEKDFVKLPPNSLAIYYLEMKLEVTGGRERWQKLIDKIGQKIDNRHHE
jgi:tetraacyldisaccharide 4'-kinase